MNQRCLFCGGDPSKPDHWQTCDGKQGKVEAAISTAKAKANRAAREAWPDFDGKTYVRTRDHARLGAQATRVWDVMKDGQWRALHEISAITGDPEASISARLRDFRKEKFGGYVLEGRCLTYEDETTGRKRLVWEFRLIIPVAVAV